MLALPLDVALTVLTAACILMCVQLVIVTVEVTRLRRDVLLLLRMTVQKRRPHPGTQDGGGVQNERADL